MSATSSGRPRPFVLAIMDGWGINPLKEGNAIALAHTPNINRLVREWPHTAVKTSGEAVGLPEGQMGNSEVGHQNIGAGKRVLQDYTRVSESIKDGSFFQNPALLKAIEHVKKNSYQLHICGLLGDGGVHAHEFHLEALLRLTQMHDVERVYVHSFTDGRDTSPTGGIEFMKLLQARAREIGGEHAAKVATVSGRYYAMDRDNRWDRTGMTYFAMTRGEGQRGSSAVAAIQQSYDQGVTDETEKYAHVTYFINGRRETPFLGEDRLLVPSPKVPTYDLQPEMSAAGITDTAVERIRSGQYDLVIMNYANADMVGHTGVVEAAIKAVEAVDTGIGRVVEATLAVGGGLLITADHGNAEQLIYYDTGKPFTAHTTYPVPLYLAVPQLAQANLRTNGILADVAPTILQIMGIAQPKDMTGRSLILP